MWRRRCQPFSPDLARARQGSVTFANGTTASKWAAVSDFGGSAEVNQYCPSYGGPDSTYCDTVLNPVP